MIRFFSDSILKKKSPRGKGGCNSRSLRICKADELDHMLLLNINRKLYVWSPMAESHWIVNDIEGSNSRFAHVLNGWTSVQYTYM